MVGVGLLAAAVATLPAWTQGGPSVQLGWTHDMDEMLEWIDESINDAWIAVGADEGPLGDPELSAVADALEEALALIDEIQDPGTYPSLDPPDIGEIDYAFDPGTLPGYAADCLALSGDALDEIQSRVVDHKVIGAQLKTIKHLITRATPHNYQSKAGIETGD